MFLRMLSDVGFEVPFPFGDDRRRKTAMMAPRRRLQQCQCQIQQQSLSESLPQLKAFRQVSADVFTYAR